jgi:hypothetical protein
MKGKLLFIIAVEHNAARDVDLEGPVGQPSTRIKINMVQSSKAYIALPTMAVNPTAPIHVPLTGNVHAFYEEKDI